MTDTLNWHLEMLRDRNLCTREFRNELRLLSRELADLSFLPQTRRGDDIVLVPILRAGLGMLEGALESIPYSSVGFMGIRRCEYASGMIYHQVYAETLPNLRGRRAVILDPMLATGGSAIMAAESLKQAGADSVIMLCAIAAPEGLNAMTISCPDVEVVTADVDEGLDENAYIVPGLGDAGDRLFGRTL